MGMNDRYKKFRRSGRRKPKGVRTTPTQQQTFVSPTGGNNNQITRGGWKPVYGCSDPDATNYNPLANTSDGSCIYEDLYCFQGGAGDIPAESCFDECVGQGPDCYSNFQSKCETGYDLDGNEWSSTQFAGGTYVRGTCNLHDPSTVCTPGQSDVECSHCFPPEGSDCGMSGAYQTTYQSFFFLCLNKNDCYAGCNLPGSAPFDLPQVDENGNYTNWCGSDYWGLFWENEWCCGDDDAPWSPHPYWDEEQDLFLYNPLTGATDILFWEPGDQMFIMDCDDDIGGWGGCELYNPFGTEELWRMGGTVVMGQGGTYNDMYNIADGGGSVGYNQNVGYTPGYGFSVTLNLEDGSWNPEFGGSEEDGQQMGMRVPSRHTIMHWKRSRGLLFRTDRQSLRVAKVVPTNASSGQADPINWEDWYTDTGASPNGYSAYGVKIFPKMAEQFGASNFGPQLVGCMDPEAMNYNPQNEIEPNNACMYQDEYCSEGLCGCTDPSAMNYDSSAIVDDGSCRYDTTPPPEDCLQCTSDRDCFNQFGYTDTGAMFCNMTYITPGEIGCCEERNPGTRPLPPRPIGRRGNVGRNTQRNRKFRRRR